MRFDFYEIIENIKYNPNSVKNKITAKTDVYLAKVSYRYKYFKQLLCLLLLILLLSFVLNGNLSYEKYYFLAKDMKLASDFVTSSHDTVTYNVGDSQSFALYRGGIAVASRERISILSASGRELYSQSHEYSNPSLISSDRFLLLYDVGGRKLSVFNSFSELKKQTFEYPLLGASISDSGDFAVITRNDKYDSVVSVFTQNGARYDYYFATGRAVGVSLSENGTKMAVALAYADNTEMNGEVRVYKVGSKDYNYAKLTFAGIPYSLKMYDNGNVCALGSKGVNTFSEDMNMLGEYLTDRDIFVHSFADDGIALAHLSDNHAKTDVLLLDKRGKISYRDEFSNGVTGVATCDGYVYLQTLSGFERVNTFFHLSEKIELSASNFKMLCVDSKTIVACADAYARFLNFD